MPSFRDTRGRRLPAALVLALVAASPAAWAGTSGIVTEPIGAWSFATKTDPLTDAKSYAIVLQAEDGQGELGIACRDTPAVPTIVVSFAARLGATDGEATRTLLYRIDDGVVIKTAWPYTDTAPLLDGTKHPARVRSLLAALAKAHRLVVRAFDTAGTAHTDVFDLDAVSKAIPRILAACKEAGG